MKKCILLVTIMAMVLLLASCSDEATNGIDKTTVKQQASDQNKASADTNKKYDIKEYLELEPEALMTKLADILDADEEETGYDNDNMNYVIIKDVLTTGWSSNGDGYLLKMNKKLDNFTIFGVSVGMSYEDAKKALVNNKLYYDETTEYYMLDDNRYVMFSLENDIVTRISYVHYLGK